MNVTAWIIGAIAGLSYVGIYWMGYTQGRVDGDHAGWLRCFDRWQQSQAEVFAAWKASIERFTSTKEQ